MTIKTSFAKFAGNSSRFVLEKFFKRGSTLPGKIALKFDPEILKSLTKNYEIIVVTGTNGKTLTTALTVGILEKAFWTSCDKSNWSQYDYGDCIYLFESSQSENW